MMISLEGTTAEGQFSLMALGAIKKADIKPRLDGDGNPKVAPNGAPTYSTPLKLLALEDGVPVGEVRNASVHVCTPTDLTFGQAYKPAGQVWITHYISGNNRLGVSVIVERIEAVRPSSMPDMPGGER